MSTMEARLKALGNGEVAESIPAENLGVNSGQDGAGAGGNDVDQQAETDRTVSLG